MFVSLSSCDVQTKVKFQIEAESVMKRVRPSNMMQNGSSQDNRRASVVFLGVKLYKDFINRFIQTLNSDQITETNLIIQVFTTKNRL